MLKLKKIYLLILALCLSTSMFAQKDKQAREVLDKTAAAMKDAGGIRAVFGGTSNGTLLLKGEQFYLNSGGVQSWFDGKTQWSYLESSDEVNISTPTPEELQGINPYSLLSLYKSGYNYKYAGWNTGNSFINLFVSKTYEPLYIKILQSNKTVNEIIVSSYQTHQPLDNESFRFDKRKYPNAEVIDLRN